MSIQDESGDAAMRGLHDGSDVGSESDELDDDEDDESEDDSDAGDDVAGEGVDGGLNDSAKGLVKQLEKELAEAPFNADLHTALITMLRGNVDLDLLTAARARAERRVALSETLWLEWLQDEASLGSDDNETLDKLHVRACEACPLSCKLWLSRCAQASRRHGSCWSGLRPLFEEALGVLQLHPIEGVELWSEYRGFEKSVLGSLPEGSEERPQQVQRIRALFMRQLSLPLPLPEVTLEALRNFEASLEAFSRGSGVMDRAKAVADSVVDRWRKREALEERMLEASRPMVTVLLAGSLEAPASLATLSADLLELAEKECAVEEDFDMLRLVHLRSVQCISSDEARWLRFAFFVGETLDDRGGAAALLERAVRHCPHSLDLWLQLVTAHEAAGATLAILRGIRDRGVEALSWGPGCDGEPGASASELLLAHADACRRFAGSASSLKTQGFDWSEMRTSLRGAAEVVGDTSCQVLLHWMRLEGYAAMDVKGTRSVGDRLVTAWGVYYNIWSASIAALRHCLGGAQGAHEAMVDLYSRAIAQVTDYPDQIRNDYMQFERECGTLQAWLAAKRWHSPVGVATLHGVDSTMAAFDEPSASVLVQRKRDRPQKPIPAARPIKERKQFRSVKADTAASPLLPHDNLNACETAISDVRAVPSEGPSRQRRLLISETDAVVMGPRTSVCDSAAVLVARGSEQSLDEQNELRVAATEKPRLAISGEKAEENMALDGERIVEAAAAKDVPSFLGDTISQEEGEVGSTATDLTPPTSKKDGSNGRQEVDEHVPHSGYHFHQQAVAQGASVVPVEREAEGDRTLFIANIDWSVTERTLENLFGEVSGFQSVRLVRDFLQRSKGYGYIDFAKSDQVDEAVKKFNGHEINKRVMKVARSLPTKPLFDDRTIFVTNLGSSTTEADVATAFQTIGEIREVRIPTLPKTGANKGYAYVEFSTDSAYDAALALKTVDLGGQPAKVARSIPLKSHRHQVAAPRKDIAQRANQKQIVDGRNARADPTKQAAACPATVYVKNLATKVGEEMLREHFTQCGEVTQVLVVRNDKGKSKGFGFVEFAKPSEAQSALALTDSSLAGREILVSKSTRAITEKKLPQSDATDKDGEQKRRPQDSRSKQAAGPNVFTDESAKRRKILDGGSEAAAAEKAPPKVALWPGAAAKVGPKGRLNLSEKPATPVVTGNHDASPGLKEASPGIDESKPAPKPLKNADFRKFLLG